MKGVAANFKRLAIRRKIWKELGLLEMLLQVIFFAFLGSAMAAGMFLVTDIT